MVQQLGTIPFCASHLAIGSGGFEISAHNRFDSLELSLGPPEDWLFFDGTTFEDRQLAKRRSTTNELRRVCRRLQLLRKWSHHRRLRPPDCRLAGEPDGAAGFVLDAWEQVLHDRRPVHCGGLVHHSDRGSQYVSIKYTERLAEAGIEPSVGSVGDSYDNALAETINGLYKAEVIHLRGPWRSFEAVEFATLEWVDWFNNRRLLEPIGNIPPAEAEQRYYAMLEQSDMAA